MNRIISHAPIALSLCLIAFTGCDQSVDNEPDQLLAADANEDEAEAEVVEGVGPEAGSDELSAGARTVQQTPGFDMSIAKAGTDLTLTWADQGAADYEVWVSDDPYFEPGDDGSMQLAAGITDLSYTHVGGNDNGDIYYRVVATQVTNNLSTTVGKLTYDIEPGYTKLGLCLINEVDTSPELFADMDTGVNSVHKFEGEAQVWDSAWNGPWDTISFAVGEVISVEHAAFAGDKTYNMVGHVPVEEDVAITLHPGDNLVSTLPLRFGDMNASDLFNMVPDVSRIGMWDAVNQQTLWFPEDGDFALPTCSPVHVEVTAASDWPPPMPEPEVSSCPCDLSVTGLAELGMTAQNTCDDTYYDQYNLELLRLEDGFGSYAYVYPPGQSCNRYSSLNSISEYVSGLTPDELNDCLADLAGLADTFDADICVY